MSELARAPITPHDRTMAVGAHVFSIFFPVFGPLIMWIVANSQPYASHHAKKAFWGDIKLFLITATIIAVSLGFSIVKGIQTIQSGAEFDWIGMIVKSIAVWLLVAAFGLWNTVSSAISALKAWRTDYWGK